MRTDGSYPIYSSGAPKPSPAPSAPAPSSGYQSALNAYSAFYEPQQAYIDLQQSQQQNKIGQMYAYNGLAASQAGQNRGFANQDYNLGMEKLGLQRGAVGSDNDYYNSLLGLLQSDYQGTLGYQDTVQKLAGKLLGIQQGSVNQNYDTSRRNQISSAIAPGAQQSLMNIKGLQDIYGTQQNQLQQLQQGYESTLAGSEEAQRAAGNAYGKSKLGVEHQLQLNQNQLQQLDIMAKDLGLSRDKALAGLQQGLAKMNLDTTIGVQDLFDAMTSGDFQKQQIANQIINQATQDYRSGYFPDSQPSTTSKSKSKSTSKSKDTGDVFSLYGA